MDVLLFLLGAAGVVGAGGLTVRLRARAARRREESSELEAVRQFAEQDVILFGEELGRLDARTRDAELDEDARADFQTALDAYESAMSSVDRLASPDSVSRIVDTLASGRHAVACVLARLAGHEPPVRRTPCFFNPQHGPATTDVRWTQPGRGTRTVPACAQDAARRAAGDEPDVLYLKINGRTVPYWEAGQLIRPYTQGYFQTSARQARLDVVARFAVANRNDIPGIDGPS